MPRLELTGNHDRNHKLNEDKTTPVENTDDLDPPPLAFTLKRLPSHHLHKKEDKSCNTMNIG